MKVVYIAPNKLMKDRAVKVFEKNNLNVRVEIANIEDGAIKAKELIENNEVDAFLARGATVTSISKITDLPIVEIPITMDDIAKAINESAKYGENIIILGFYNLIGGLESFNPLLKVNVKQVYISNESEIEGEIIRAKKEGIDVVIGGEVQCAQAARYNLNSVFLESSELAILNSYYQAETILKNILIERKNAEEIKTIIDNIKDGFLVVTYDGKINIMNRCARKILLLETDEKIDLNYIKRNFKESLKVFKDGEYSYNNISRIGNKRIVYSCIPVKVEEVITGVVITFNNLLRIQETEQDLRTKMYRDGFYAKYKFQDIYGESPDMKKVKEIAYDFARTDSTILIAGETGTGKELFAQSIHNASGRSEKPFVAINCASLPVNILESELFGYVEGAFTGAMKEGKLGIFELAHTGTIFLDEIDAIPIELQGRLLRVLEEQTIMKLGDDKIIPIDVRIISATNTNLQDLVKDGKFRVDLYYRLNVLPIELPSLRDRKEDISGLIKIFLREFESEESMEEDMVDLLKTYHWPGNVRELRNLIERYSILSKSRLDKNSVYEYILRELSLETSKEISQDDIERILLLVDGNRTKAAEMLGISRTTLWRRLKEFV